MAGAERIFEQVKAAKLLLETQPVPGLAEKLRIVTAQLAQAEEDKASAEADLAQIHGLRQKHWIAAANSLQISGTTIAPPKFATLMAQRDKARDKLEEACANVQELLRKAVAAQIEPLAADLAVLNVAVDNWHQRVGEVKEGVFVELMGNRPSGVIKNGHTYQLAATP